MIVNSDQFLISFADSFVGNLTVSFADSFGGNNETNYWDNYKKSLNNG